MSLLRTITRVEYFYLSKKAPAHHQPASHKIISGAGKIVSSVEKTFFIYNYSARYSEAAKSHTSDTIQCDFGGDDVTSAPEGKYLNLVIVCSTV